MSEYIIAVDQSTSATKAYLLDRDLGLLWKSSKEHRQHYPQPGWVEHDPEEIYFNTLEVLREIVKHLLQIRGAGFKLACLSLSNQRETVVVWDKKTGTSVYPAIVWQDYRGSERCRKLKQDGWEDTIKAKTGLLIDPYFSATAVSWILKNVKKAARLAARGDLLFGTIDSWLIWKLTGGMVHATDYSNASRTMLYDIHELRWDPEIMEELGIPLDMAPSVRSANAHFGTTNLGGLLRNEVPITGVLGDSHAALFGHKCFSPGMGKATFGTGSSIMYNIGEKALVSPKGLVTSIGYGLNDKITYVFEGNIHSTGATMAWMKDGLGVFETVEETDGLAQSLASNDGVYIVPAFAGLGAPHWDHDVRAMIMGMTFATTRAHLARAGLEAIAYQVKDLVDLMANEAGIALGELRVDGGAVRNNFLMQFLADMLCARLAKSQAENASAFGAALAGGLGAGLWKELKEASKIDHPGEVISGCMDQASRDQLYSGWRRAVGLALSAK